jgi:hypothetical protein
MMKSLMVLAIVWVLSAGFAGAQDVHVSAPVMATAGTYVAASVVGRAGHTFDWVTFVPVTYSDTQFDQWAYMSGSHVPPSPAPASATLYFTAPLAAGAYEYRLYADNGYTRLATSPTIHISSPQPPTVALNYGTGVVVEVGQTIIVSRPADFAVWAVSFDASVLQALTPADEMPSPPGDGWRFLALAPGATTVHAAAVFVNGGPPPPFWEVAVIVR